MKFTYALALLPASTLLCDAAPVDSVFGDFSATCKQSLFSIVTGNEPCLPLSQIWTQANSINWENYDATNISQYTSLLDTMCSAPRCNKLVTDELAKTIRTQCAADTAHGLIQVLEYGLRNYEPLIAVECVQDSQQQYCLLVEAKDIEANKNTDVTDIPDEKLCTECVESWVKVYDQYSVSYADMFTNSTDISRIKERCGY